MMKRIERMSEIATPKKIKLNLSDLVVRDFVLVNYEEELFPGNVLTKDDEGTTCRSMDIIENGQR